MWQQFAAAFEEATGSAPDLPFQVRRRCWMTNSKMRLGLAMTSGVGGGWWWWWVVVGGGGWWWVVVVVAVVAVS
ncbi:hypothetical protein AK812_SmicGene41677 [Symbiodinium microadriaticum]|uniref:Uncharacterized protein n=1 Tax=Symbiodinium microadriaticum TaxID=2951 RepID=A0A1Q9C5I9_SYMMI|nr:hypothetical protein AK812_SmicGene41677 [Symbiodinium microadriaticum]